MSLKTVEQMKYWIAENITEEVNLERMADHVGYSPCYCSQTLSECFRRGWKLWTE